MHGTITTDGQYCGSAKAPAMVSAGTQDPATILETTSFRIYPNPTTGAFTLEQPAGGTFQNMKVEIYSMLGIRIMTDDIIGENRHRFLLSSEPAGIYLVRILTGDQVETIKVIKH